MEGWRGVGVERRGVGGVGGELLHFASWGPLQGLGEAGGGVEGGGEVWRPLRFSIFSFGSSLKGGGVEGLGFGVREGKFW